MSPPSNPPGWCVLGPNPRWIALSKVKILLLWVSFNIRHDKLVVMSNRQSYTHHGKMLLRGPFENSRKGQPGKCCKLGDPRWWDDCLELESEIRSSMVNNVLKQDCKVPKTKLRCETANITHISDTATETCPKLVFFTLKKLRVFAP